MIKFEAGHVSIVLDLRQQLVSKVERLNKVCGSIVSFMISQ